MLKKLLMVAVVGAFFSVMGCAETHRDNGNTSGHQTTIQWNTNYDKAMSEAKKQNKPLLLFFTGSDWCGWCKKIESEVFQTPEFAQAAGNDFIFVELDFPLNQTQPPDIVQQNAALKQKYGITGFPTVVIVSSDGNYIGKTGYRPGGGKAFADFLKKDILGG